MVDATDSAATTRILREARQHFQDRFGVQPAAYSVDGRTFAFQAPLSLRIRPGGYCRIQTREGTAFLGQVLERDVFAMQGPEIQVGDKPNQQLEAIGISVGQARIQLPTNILRGSGVILAELTNPTSSDRLDGFHDAEISVASTDDIRLIYQAWSATRPTLTIGSLESGQESTPVSIDASGFNRHTFLCGQSGSGKTYSLGVLLEQLLLETDLRIAILDPNADYIGLNTPRSDSNGPADDESERVRQRYLNRVRDLHVLRPDEPTDERHRPLRIRFSDLSPEDQARTLQLDPLADRNEFDAFWSMVSRVGLDRYQLRDVQQSAQTDLSATSREVLLRISNLGVERWNVWARADQASLVDVLEGDWRSLVLDVSRFERPIERSVVALATLRHFWRNRESRKPVLIVIDEAHNVCPKEPLDAIQAAATELAISIAGEGRKYGIYLFLSTQRPDKLHPNVLSQCDNLMLMRMNSRADLEDLQRIFSFVPAGILAESPAFRQGEALMAGKIVPSPMLVKIGARLSAEGGVDVPTTWASPARD